MDGVPATIDECRTLAQWAEELPPETNAPVTAEQIGRHMQFLNATLPSRNVDHETGKSRFAVYVSILRELSEEQMAFVAREACRRLKWLPTPAECLEIAKEFRKRESERESALQLCAHAANRLAEEWIAAPDLSMDVPDQWKRIAFERGVLRLTSDGYALRR